MAGKTKRSGDWGKEVHIRVHLNIERCGGENVRSRSEEIRQSNCNAYINCYADLLPVDY